MAPRTRKSAGSGEKKRCLVTGGSGFLGRHLVEQVRWPAGLQGCWAAAAAASCLACSCTAAARAAAWPLLQHDPARTLTCACTATPPTHLQLLDSGRYDVTVFDIRAVEGEDRARYIVGDLRDAAQVADACSGEHRAVDAAGALLHAQRAFWHASSKPGCCAVHLPSPAGMDVVFHVATAAPTAHNAHNEALMTAVNVDGTQVPAAAAAATRAAAAAQPLLAMLRAAAVHAHAALPPCLCPPAPAAPHAPLLAPTARGGWVRGGRRAGAGLHVVRVGRV